MLSASHTVKGFGPLVRPLYEAIESEMNAGYRSSVGR
jgi:hypothetical protein